MSLVENDSLQKLVIHAKETSAVEPENILPKGEIEQETPDNTTHEPENVEEENVTLNKDGTPRKKRGRKSQKEVEISGEPIDAALLINSILIEPVGGFFLSDASIAMYNEQQGKLLNQLMPTGGVKPSWGAFITVGSLMAGTNILKAVRIEKQYKNMTAEKINESEIVIFTSRLNDEQLQFFVNKIDEESKRRAKEQNKNENNLNEEKN